MLPQSVLIHGRTLEQIQGAEVRAVAIVCLGLAGVLRV